MPQIIVVLVLVSLLLVILLYLCNQVKLTCGSANIQPFWMHLHIATIWYFKFAFCYILCFTVFLTVSAKFIGPPGRRRAPQ